MNTLHISPGDKLPCPACLGTGLILGRFGERPSVCRDCAGKGSITKPAEPQTPPLRSRPLKSEMDYGDSAFNP